MRSIGAALVLFALWLLMSGLYSKNLIVGLGAVSAIFAVYVVRRMDAIDGDKVEIHLNLFQTIKYDFWLLVEIAKANWAVTKVIVSGAPSNQHLFYTPSSQKSELGQVIFANSITLTPGTITVETEDDRFLVHALNYSDDDLEALADMDARVTATESRAAS